MQSFWYKKRVLVTGAGGFIGSWVTEQLVNKGARVTAAYNHHTEHLRHLKNRVSLVKCDLTNPLDTRSIVKNNEIVIHLASKVAGIQYTMNHPVEMFEDNIEMAKNILHASHKNKVERVLIVSSACVYPRHAKTPTPEDQGFINDPEPTNIGYGWSKRVVELMARFYHQEYGLKVAIARPYNAYGPRDHFDPKTSHVIPGLIKRVLENENPLVVWGTGKQTRSFIYVEDLAKGLLELVEKYPVPEPVNLGSAQEISVGDLAKLIITISGKQTESIYDRSKPDGQPRRLPDTKKAKKMIGFKAETPLEIGLKKTIAWYQKQPSLSSRVTKSKALKK